VCEWRSGFASAALTIVQAFYDDNDFETDESRQAFARDALENYSFLYREVSMHKNEVSDWSCCQVSLLIHFSRNARVFLVEPSLLKPSQRTTTLSVVPQIPLY
jgi:hypothetical protein